jgi:hypothetical protein
VSPRTKTDWFIPAREDTNQGFAELKYILEGFKTLVYLDTENLKMSPMFLYNEKITKVIYYKAEGLVPSYWSFGYNDKGKLITVSREF